MKALDIDPVHDTRQTFRTLCTALSHPGTIKEVGVTPADHAVVATLVDHELQAQIDDEELRSALDARGRYEAADADEADIIHTRGTPSWDIRNVSRGTLLEPSDGATVIYRVETLTTPASSSSSPSRSAFERDGTINHDVVRIDGPGVPAETDRTVTIGLPPEELDRISIAQSTYPRGVDVIITTAESVLAIPRSVSISRVTHEDTKSTTIDQSACEQGSEAH
ncbi:phosphonate C-P lyase system protein PhnH [Haloquadratum walsbyi]|jgi:phosphonate C-P lyase system protein PhnH|uniref:Phosphonate C-P lyase system protein PhnH n=1 Tax=Haloquadratum walsbyi J07HQW2 TaxID=1238425 RepID=U1NJ41_9EURY|nr:phosphonate C-P lyase system protein PhnH [Haloquadratum walsbyi]ERG97260.1 MAG: phosphonate C-P lyase system protein PhnH [Haloquadratum walsbyi J07HQW2]